MHRLINNNGGSLDLKCAIEHASFEQVISQLYSIASIDPNVWERTYVLPAIVLYAVLEGGHKDVSHEGTANILLPPWPSKLMARFWRCIS